MERWWAWPSVKHSLMTHSSRSFDHPIRRQWLAAFCQHAVNFSWEDVGTAATTAQCTMHWHSAGAQNASKIANDRNQIMTFTKWNGTTSRTRLFWDCWQDGLRQPSRTRTIWPGKSEVDVTILCTQQALFLKALRSLKRCNSPCFYRLYKASGGALRPPSIDSSLLRGMVGHYFWKVGVLSFYLF